MQINVFPLSLSRFSAAGRRMASRSARATGIDAGFGVLLRVLAERVLVERASRSRHAGYIVAACEFTTQFARRSVVPDDNARRGSARGRAEDRRNCQLRIRNRGDIFLSSPQF